MEESCVLPPLQGKEQRVNKRTLVITPWDFMFPCVFGFLWAACIYLDAHSEEYMIRLFEHIFN